MSPYPDCAPVATRAAPRPTVNSWLTRSTARSDLFQCLNDVGFTTAARGVTYWNGQAMHTTDYQDLPETPAETASATAGASRNAAHLAALLRDRPSPPAESS